ncbi:MFS transporter [Streptomyces sp. NBC_01795]|uniref:MFS transporter n=1 Tax=Streptomyces sp. NBC_01795 TaxID=2975943 RepID=UPI002DD8ECCE|nr:MFS transporter [Streptomyces sp. NBC_01795]WSA92985.1 MFS transporter [Streptomyces sp. NBC_01795]
MRKWWPLTAVCLGAFILLVDVTIVNVALPSMADDLDASFSSLQWVIDAYALALAALLLASGSLADRFGHRRFYIYGLGVFGLASLVCGLAPNAEVLIAARGVQGAGGAAMFATAPALLLTSYQGRDRGTAFGVWGAANGAAAAAGPLLGGLLTEHFSWPTIFWVNLPIAAVAIAMTLRVVRADQPADQPVGSPAGQPVGSSADQPVGSPGHGARPGGTPARVDIPGATAFTVAAATLTYGLIRGGEVGWTSAEILATFAVTALALVAFVVIEHRTARRGGAPMLDLALLRRPSFAALMSGALLLQGGAFGCLVLVSLWLQSVLGLSPVGAGLALTPMAGASFLVAAVAGRHIQRLAPRLPIGVGLLFVAAGMLLLRAGMTADAGQTALMGGLVVAGIGVGLATPVLVSAATSTVPQRQAGMAGGAVNTFRQLGMTLAIAVLGTVFTSRTATALAGPGTVPDPDKGASALAAGQAQHVMDAAPPGHRDAAHQLVHQAFATGLDRVFLASALAAAVGGLIVLALVRPPRRSAAGGAATVRAAAVPGHGGSAGGGEGAGDGDGDGAGDGHGASDSDGVTHGGSASGRDGASDSDSAGDRDGVAHGGSASDSDSASDRDGVRTAAAAGRRRA